MKNDKIPSSYYSDIAAQISDEKLPEIDFDLLSTRLREASGRLRQAEKTAAEFALLKEDYQSRICGMLKAIAAVDRKRGALLSALESIQKLDRLSAADLVECYRSTSARFRDFFPSSFSSLTLNGTSHSRLRDVADFK